MKTIDSSSTSPVTRRTFLRTGTVFTTAVAALSPLARAQTNLNSKLRLYQIGVGGMGGADRGQLKSHPQIEWAGFTDVDQRELDKMKKEFPKAWSLKDYREAFANKVGDFDAVLVATPDFHHAPMMITA
ncbi:MAG: gfo/Idh/MocA family oxidoreductase, partial [Verrucomicrobia bacterium]|nr:gfo/Idh/MocA family oxidoreductase [Verrucomicrobiota bacterium]